MSRDGAEKAGELEPIDDAERAFAEAEVDAVLDTYRGRLGAADLELMRATLLEGLTRDPGSRALVRAALPRNVDESGDVYYGPRSKKPRRTP
jgi:hypothetical protein